MKQGGGSESWVCAAQSGSLLPNNQILPCLSTVLRKLKLRALYVFRKLNTRVLQQRFIEV